LAFILSFQIFHKSFKIKCKIIPEKIYIDTLFRKLSKLTLKSKIITNQEKVNFEINTINGKSKKEGFIIENVVVKKDSQIITTIEKIIFSFELNGRVNEKYSAIIGYDTYIDDLKGVIL